MEEHSGEASLLARIRANNWVILLLAGLLFLFGVMFYCEGGSTLKTNQQITAKGKNFAASGVLSGLTYDRQTKYGVGRVELNIKANKPELEVNSVGLSYEEDPSDQSRSFQYCHVGDSCLNSFEEPGPSGQLVSTAAIQFDTVHFRATENTAEVFYPFDSPAFHLSFSGCVNHSVDVCPPEDELFFTDFRVELADADFVLGNRSLGPSSKDYVVSLQRKLFIRGVSLLFLVISLVFFIYLLQLSKSDELMTKSLGFFGTLWGLRALLVPSTVKVFPTSIDYVILGEFCLLFFLVLVGVQTTHVQVPGGQASNMPAHEAQNTVEKAKG